MSQVIQLPEYTQLIFRSSFLSILSVISAWNNRCYDNFALASLVMCSSILYWRDPVDGWRRRLDMMAVNGTVLYQVFYSALFIEDIAVRAIYWCIVVSAIECYLLARYYGRVLGDFEVASQCHVGLHLLGNVSNLILYNSLKMTPYHPPYLS